MPKNVRDLGKLIVAKGFIKLPKVQKIAQSGHTAHDQGCIGWAQYLGQNVSFLCLKIWLKNDGTIVVKDAE